MSWVDEFKLLLDIVKEVGPDKVADKLRAIIQSVNEVWSNGRTAIFTDNDIADIEDAIMWLDVLQACKKRAQEQ